MPLTQNLSTFPGGPHVTFLRQFAPHAHWFLRLALASVFAYHGLTKFPNLEALSGMMGMPVPMIAMLATVETIAAAMILVGGISKDWMTRLAGLIFVMVMLGAIFMVHLKNGWNSLGNMGMEFPVTLLAIGLFFAIRGNDGVESGAAE